MGGWGGGGRDQIKTKSPVRAEGLVVAAACELRRLGSAPAPSRRSAARRRCLGLGLGLGVGGFREENGGEDLC